MSQTGYLLSVFARNLKERRRKLRMTQAALAEKIGVSTSFITEIETTRKTPSFATIDKISKALQTPAWTFFCENGDQLPGNVTTVDQFGFMLKQQVSDVIDKVIKEFE